MADSSSLQQQINTLKFQLALLGSGNPDSDTIKRQINDLQRQLMIQKTRDGMG